MNVYQTCYDLVNQYIYGNTVAVGSYQELCCIAVATCASLFVFAIPFLLVKKIINML